MLIATQKELLLNGLKLLPITSHVLFEEQTGRFFKFTDFEPSACFIGQTLSEPRSLTLTPYDPVFLAIEKIWPLQQDTNNTLDNMLDEKDAYLLPYLQSSIERICEQSEKRGSIYYKPSPEKIVVILKGKYERLLKVCSENGISLRKPGLETKDPINIGSPIVINILKRDIDEFFIRKLQDELQIEQVKPEVAPFTFQQRFSQQEESPKKNLRKSQKPHTQAEIKKEREIKQIKSQHTPLTNFFKKKEPEQPSQLSEPQQPSQE